ncbi:hypothetical protein THAOC_11143 [Thalassiosira oceanica]|uniref:Uncharacterized protein n=1 Tax=Thalassiosira oceanica TaxID=159749 RepID=K0SNF2_THAOC|nr:hypothetical protein THAOC_11143 [Thalassiosira oceanica]|eukprot:EJK67783.1 hypothetical protein THAOC_11143 [Thalassiosira oceanica]
MANLRRRLAQASVLAVSLLQGARAFYIPGVRPHEFAQGEEVPMKVNSLTSIHTQVREEDIAGDELLCVRAFVSAVFPWERKSRPKAVGAP